MSDQTAQKTAAAKKGNKTTELVVGAAASRIENAVKALLSVSPEIGKLTVIAQESTLKVADLEDKIGGLKQDYENKSAQAKIELQQAYDSNREAFAQKWLAEKGLISIARLDLASLEGDLADATQKVDEKVAKAVGAATSSMKKDHEQALAISKLEMEKLQASNAAEIVQLKNQNTFLVDQVNHWKTMLETQQKNETERAKYGQIGTMNVGTGQQGR